MLFDLLCVGLRLQLSTWKQQWVDHFSGAISILLEQVIFLVVLFAIGNITCSVNGWSLNDILLLYGFNRVCLSIADTLGENLWLTGGLARDGDLIIYKAAPLNLLLLLILNKIHFERLLGGACGIVLMVYSYYQIGIDFDIWKFAVLFVSMILGSLVLLAIMIFGSALTIKYVGSDPVGLLWSIVEFSKYPVGIFGRFGSFVFTYLIPLVMTGYLPIKFLLAGSQSLSGLDIFLTPIMCVALFVASATFWLQCLQNFEGTGS